MQIIYSERLEAYVVLTESKFGQSMIAVDKDRVVAIIKGTKRLQAKQQ